MKPQTIWAETLGAGNKWAEIFEAETLGPETFWAQVLSAQTLGGLKL